MKRLVLFCFYTFFLMSCKSSLSYYEGYARDGKKSTYLKKNYKKIDSIEKVKIELCKEREIPILAHTDGAIFFDSKSLERALINSIENHFGQIKYKESNTGSWSQGCKNLLAKNFLNTDTEAKQSTDSTGGYYFDVTMKTHYLTRKNIDYGAAFESSADLGNDIHKIKYRLVLALFKNNSLKYMDNHAHWTEVYSKRGEKLHYEVPQSIIDSLVTKSLAEYYKRLAPN